MCLNTYISRTMWLYCWSNSCNNVKNNSHHYFLPFPSCCFSEVRRRHWPASLPAQCCGNSQLTIVHCRPWYIVVQCWHWRYYNSQLNNRQHVCTPSKMHIWPAGISGEIKVEGCIVLPWCCIAWCCPRLHTFGTLKNALQLCFCKHKIIFWGFTELTQLPCGLWVSVEL